MDTACTSYHSSAHAIDVSELIPETYIVCLYTKYILIDFRVNISDL